MTIRKLALCFLLLYSGCMTPDVHEYRGPINKLYDPCDDSMYITLKKISIDSLSKREYEYFLAKEKECADYNRTILQTRPTQKMADQYSDNSSLLYILLVLGLAGAAMLYIINSNNK